MKYLTTIALSLFFFLPQLYADISVTLADDVTCVCPGNPQQAFIVTATGTAGPFTYEWSGPEGYTSNTMMPFDIEVGGMYTLLVTNVYECTFAYNVEVPACEAPTLEVDVNNCIGELTLNIEGGIAPFEISWAEENSGAIGVTEAIASDLEPGNYFAKVTDGNGCIHYTNVVAVDNDPDILEFSIIRENASCPTLDNGSITVNMLSGEPEFIFTWYSISSNGELFTILGETENVLSGLEAGNYGFEVIDQNGCTASYLGIILLEEDVSNNQYPYISGVQMWVEVNTTQQLIYSANWQDDGEGCIIYNNDGSLQPGQEVLFAIQQGAAVSVQATTNIPMGWLQLELPGTGSSTVGVQGGTLDGTTWDFDFSSGVPNMTVVGNDIEQNLSFSGIESGDNAYPLLDLMIYSNDLASCAELPVQQEDCSWEPVIHSGTDQVHTVIINGCEGITAPNTGNEICPKITPVSSCGGADGGISFIGSCPFGGTTGALSYQWSNGATTLSIGFLTAGIYTLTVTDAVGCEGIFEYLVPSFGAPIINENAVNVVGACEGQDNGFIYVELMLIDGDQNSIFSDFEWSNGIITEDNVFSSIEGLSAGEYTVTITNTYTLCEVVRSFTVEEVVQNDPLSASANILSHTCYNQATGEVSITLNGGIPPYYVGGNYVIAGNEITFSGIPEGQYCKTLTDHCGEAVEVCVDIEVQDNSTFDILLDQFSHASTSGANDGSISVVVSPPGDYSFEWVPGNSSSSQITNLAPGTYTLFVGDNHSTNGCKQERTFVIEDCANVEDFDVEIGGGLIFDGQQEVPVWALIGVGNTLPVIDMPNGFTISWSGSSTLNIPSSEQEVNPLILDVQDVQNTIDRRVFATISNGCQMKTIEKHLFICGEEGGELFFVDTESTILPCQGLDEGEIHIRVPLPMPDSEVSLFRKEGTTFTEITLQNGLPLEKIGIISQLFAGDYEFRVVIDDLCITDFTFSLEEKPTQTDFHEYDVSTETCIYQESCNGLALSFPTDDPFYDPANGTSHNCRVPIYCPSHDPSVGYREYSKRVCRGLEYITLLNAMYVNQDPNFHDIFGTPTLDVLRNSFKEPWECKYVRYCTGNMKIVSKWGIKGKAEFDGIANNGCWKYRCPPLVPNIRMCEGETCLSFPDYSINGDVPLPILSCYNYEYANLHALLYLYEQGMLEQISNTTLYANIADLSILLTEEERERAKCAKVYYCADDNDYLYHTSLDEINCEDVEVPEYAQEETYINCGPFTCIPAVTNVLQGSVFKPTCTVVETIWDENGNIIAEEIRCRPDNCPLGQDCSYTWVVDYASILVNLGIDPMFQPDVPEVKLLQDPFFVEQLDNFGFVQYQGTTIPKGMLTTNIGKAFYDYTPGTPDIERKVAEDNLIYTIQNWDTQQDLFVHKIESGINIHYSDSLMFWDNAIVSDSISVTNVQVLENGQGIDISGNFLGSLVVDEFTQEYAGNYSTFFVQFSLTGEVQEFSIAENTIKGNTRSASYFNPKGNAILVSEYSVAGGDLILDGEIINIPPNSESGQLVAMWDLDTYSFLSKKKVFLPTDVSIVASTVLDDSYAFLVKNAGGYQILGQDSISIQKDTTAALLMSFDLNGQMGWVKPLSGRITDINNLAYSNDGSLFLGMTIVNDITVDNITLSHIGKADIAFCRFSQTGDLLWSDVYGTSETETVEKIFIDHNNVFFAGQFLGDINERQIGEDTFYDYITENNEVYISSFSFDDLQAIDAPNGIEHDSYISSLKEEKVSIMGLYPNPSSGEINISMISIQDQKIDIVLADIYGRPINIWPSYSLNKGENRISVSPSNSVVSGIYLLKLLSSDKKEELAISKIIRF